MDSQHVDTHRTFLQTPQEVLIVGLLAVLLLALVAPGIIQVRERARQNQNTHQMKLIGQSLNNYHDTHRSFPAGPSAKPKSAPGPESPAAELISPLVVLPAGSL